MEEATEAALKSQPFIANVPVFNAPPVMVSSPIVTPPPLTVAQTNAALMPEVCPRQVIEFCESSASATVVPSGTTRPMSAVVVKLKPFKESVVPLALQPE